MEAMGDRIALLAAGFAAINIAAPGVGAIVTIFLAGLAISAAAIVWFSLLIRKALLLVAIVFGPIALAGSSWDATKGWFGKWATFVIALIFSKLVLVVIFLVAISQVSAPIELDLASISDPIAGVVLMFIAAFAPYITYKFLSFVGFDMYHAMSAEQEAKSALNRPVPVPSAPKADTAKKVLDGAGDSAAAASTGAGGGTPPAAYRPAAARAVRQPVSGRSRRRMRAAGAGRLVPGRPGPGAGAPPGLRLRSSSAARWSGRGDRRPEARRRGRWCGRQVTRPRAARLAPRNRAPPPPAPSRPRPLRPRRRPPSTARLPRLAPSPKPTDREGVTDVDQQARAVDFRLRAVQFSRLTRRGILLGLSLPQLIVLAIAVLTVVGALYTGGGMLLAWTAPIWLLSAALAGPRSVAGS